MKSKKVPNNKKDNKYNILIQNIDNEPYIVLLEDVDHIFTPDKILVKDYSDMNFLLNFIKTVKNISIYDYHNYINNDYDFNNFTHYESKDVIEWCKKYGLLDIDNNIFERSNQKCFSLQLFYKHALTLKLMYNLWISLKTQSKDNPVAGAADSIYHAKKLVTFMGYDDIIRNFIDVKKLVSKIVTHCNEVIRNIYLSFNYPSIMSYDEIDSAIKKKLAQSTASTPQGKEKVSNGIFSDTPLWNVTANNILEVLYYQFLCLFCNNKKDGFSQIRQCIYCGSDFYGNKNSFYCPSCPRSTVKSEEVAAYENFFHIIEQRLINHKISKEIIDAVIPYLKDRGKIQQLIDEWKNS